MKLFTFRIFMLLLLSSSLGAEQRGHLELRSNSKSVLIFNPEGKKTGFDEESGRVYRQIDKSDWEVRPAFEPGIGEGLITIGDPILGVYRIEEVPANQGFLLHFMVSHFENKKSEAFSVVGNSIPGEKLIFMLDLNNESTLDIPFDKIRETQRAAGFYFEIKNPHFDGFLVENSDGERFGNDAAELKNYSELTGVTLGTTVQMSPSINNRSWGMVFSKNKKGLKLILTKNRNNNLQEAKERELFQVKITRWKKSGSLLPPMTVDESISWGGRIIIPIELKPQSKSAR